MQRIYHLVVVLFFLCPVAAIAQAENNTWMLPGNIGMDFSKSPPDVFNAPVVIGTTASCATVSDATGQLLFYTNGFSVWNKEHKVMPNGSGLVSALLANNQSAVVPVPGNSNLYVLFTVDDAHILSYSMIDLSLDTGRGDIVDGAKSIALADSISTGMKGIRGGGCYNWLLAHRTSSANFVTFKIDETGVQTNPVVSASGFYNTPNAYYVNDLQVSADGTKVTIASDGHYFVELHSFDKNTGIVHNPALVAQYLSSGRAHSACFSGDGSKLYVTGGLSGSDLVQFDLDSLPVLSMTKLNDSHNINGALRRGPDGKIYSVNREGIYTVMTPDRAGTNANLQYDYVKLPSGVLGVPAFMGGDIIPPVTLNNASHRTDTLICASTAIISAPPGYQSYFWSDGDTSVHRFVFQNGRYILYSFSGCGQRTDSFNIEFSDCNCLVSIPSAFSPNNDSRNDVFHVMGNEIQSIEINVCNRWGQRVFHTVNSANTVDWDGTFNGIHCEVGTYYYWVRVRCIKGQVIFRKGDLTLVR